MARRVDDRKYEEFLELSLNEGLVEDDDTTLIFYDVAELRRQTERVRAAFPRSATHAAAVKTNPLGCVLQYAASLGLAAEAASFEELWLARRAGFGDRLIWDSPAKTTAEIDQCARNPPHLINLNTIEELALFENAVGLRLGVRINPEVRSDTIPSLEVGQKRSKFGTPISRREDLEEACLADPRIDTLHVHACSNSRSLEPMVDAVEKTFNLAEEINAIQRKRGHSPSITRLDIGGGLPLSVPEDQTLSVERYASLLRERCPELFEPPYEIVTEFGRYYHYTAGWTASRVHSIQSDREPANLVVHVGADAFVREVYDSENWPLAFEAAKNSPAAVATEEDYRICGPLCFEGDVLSTRARLPTLAPNDWLIIRETGANTYALWSRHCSRLLPKVLLTDSTAGTVWLGKTRESLDDLARFWG